MNRMPLLQYSTPMLRVDPSYEPTAEFHPVPSAYFEPIPTQQSEEVRVTVTYEEMPRDTPPNLVLWAAMGIAGSRGWKPAGYLYAERDERISAFRVVLWCFRC